MKYPKPAPKLLKPTDKLFTPKPLTAVERTVDMFASVPNVDEVETSDTPEPVIAGREQTIEQAVDRYRAQAFVGQEWTSKAFGASVTTLDVTATTAENSTLSTTQTTPLQQTSTSGGKTSDSFRLSAKAGWLYLEQLRHQPGKPQAYHYAGVMFPQDSLLELTEVFVQAARAFKAKSTP